VYDPLPSSWKSLWLLAAGALMVAAVVFVWPSLRAQRSLRFWACGAAISGVPLAAGVPSDRLLTLLGLGVMPVLATAICDALQKQSTPFVRRSAFVLSFLHLVVDPLMLPLSTLTPAALARDIERLDRGVPDTPAVREQTVIVVGAPNSALLTYLPVMRSLQMRARPQRLHWLVVSKDTFRVERRAGDLLRVVAPGGVFEPRWDERNSRLPLQRGEHIALSELTVAVREVTADGIPTVCDFLFRQPLESSNYVWLTWRVDHLEPFVVPSAGEAVAVSAND
jgi:hypothetical protein